MLSCPNALLILAIAWLAVDIAEAWAGHAPRKHANTRASPIHDAGEGAEDAAMIIRGRRKFIFQSLAIFLPVVGHAEDEAASDIVKEEKELAKAETVQISEDEKELAAEPAKEENTGQGNDVTVHISELAKEDNAGKEKGGSVEVSDIVKEEQELFSELAKEENEEEKAAEDTQRLITELEEQIKDEANDSKPDEHKMQSNKNLIDTLEKEEEKIESEAIELITKIETLEKDTAEGKDASPAVVPDASTTQEFLTKLKERVGEKEDLIARLKRESEKDIDPKTGKFKAMTSNEFKARAPSDFDFLEYLKESLSNTEEFERDLEAFEGLLESKLGPVIEGVRNAAKEVKEMVKK